MRATDQGGAEQSPFGPLLREFRIAAKLSQEELAERAHVSVACIGVLERGVRRAPRRETFALLAAGLELSPRDRARFQAAALRASATRPSSAPPADNAPAGQERTPAFANGTTSAGLAHFGSYDDTRCAHADFATLPYVDLLVHALGLALRRSTVDPNIASFQGIGEKRLLVALEGFEHLLGAAAAATQQLVRQLSGQTISSEES